jgi:sugar/nucleoside kinase (ribokinase family)
VGALLPLVDVFLPNENEALALSDQPDLESAACLHAADVVCCVSRQAAQLSRQCGLLAIKLGDRGGLVPQGDRIVRAPALPVAVADTVGAGDSFDAGFLYGYLNGWSVERSLRLACACGSLSTRLPGGTQAQPTLDEALAALGEPLNR